MLVSVAAIANSGKMWRGLEFDWIVGKWELTIAAFTAIAIDIEPIGRRATLLAIIGQDWRIYLGADTGSAFFTKEIARRYYSTTSIAFNRH
jgi:hypothetical protein